MSVVVLIRIDDTGRPQKVNVVIETVTKSLVACGNRYPRFWHAHAISKRVIMYGRLGILPALVAIAA